MNREHQINRIRHYDRLFPAGTTLGWADGGGSHQTKSIEGRHPEFADWLHGETEEAGLTRIPQSRYRTVLVPLDGKPFSEHALPFALGIARRSGAEIRLVHVHSPLESIDWAESLFYHAGLDVWNRRRQQAYLDSLVQRLAKVSSVPVTPVLMQGREVVDSLCEAANVGADLVVMATHRRNVLGRLWCGSIADVLMQQMSVPLLLVRGYNAPADLTGDPHMRQILIPLDGSKLAEQVIEPALALSALAVADHMLLRVVPLKSHGANSDDVAPQQSLGDRATEAQAYLSRVAESLRGRTARIRSRIVLHSRPISEVILDAAKGHDADVIALATQGRGGLSRLVRSSIADHVLRGTSVPVLVFRPDS